jgi:hypothetical protein
LTGEVQFGQWVALVITRIVGVKAFMDRIAIIGTGATKSVIAMVMSKYPDAEVIVVDDVRDLSELSKPEPIPFTPSHLIQQGMEMMHAQIAELRSDRADERRRIKNDRKQMDYRARQFRKL